MKALIVAAGHGSRLRSVSPSKPLTPVAGVPLIARVIAAARAGGATSFVVVTGYEAAPLETYLADREGLAITTARTDDWDLANGHSVLTGAAIVGPDPHLLMMADHLFDAGVVECVIAAPPAPLTLAIDRRLAHPMVDLDDVTRVRTAGDRIVAIAKHLAPFDAFDCGVFRVDGVFHAALRETIAAGGNGSISSGVEALAARGQAQVADIGDHFWLDVDDPAALVKAETWLSVAEAQDPPRLRGGGSAKR